MLDNVALLVGSLREGAGAEGVWGSPRNNILQLEIRRAYIHNAAFSFRRAPRATFLPEEGYDVQCLYRFTPTNLILQGGRSQIAPTGAVSLPNHTDKSKFEDFKSFDKSKFDGVFAVKFHLFYFYWFRIK